MASRLLVGTRKGLFTVARGADGWSVDGVSMLGDNVTLAMSDPRSDGRDVYAALDHGHFGVKLHRSSDGGASFEEVGVPVYPEKPEGDDDDPTENSARPVPWSLKLIWALEAGGAGQDGRLWCGTIPGGLFVSDDRGDTWRLVESLWFDERRKGWFGGGADFPGIHSVCVHPEHPERVTIGISCGGVWQTRDDGASWELRADGMRAEYMPPDLAGEPNTQDPHCVVQSPTSPDVFWTQHHNGIFRSTDGCASWHELTSDVTKTFGFPVAVHPTDPDTAWFVPAVKDEQRYPEGGRVVVTRTRDGGKTFEVLTKGLPQTHAYDLVFRHALDVDETGDVLAFGSTTGSLWISEDAGDSWQHVSAHLPPVYSVRFG